MQPQQQPSLATVRVAEFFSGIGGMHCAVRLFSQLLQGPAEKAAEFSYTLAGAFDVNNIANAVYESNFPGIRVCTASLESLSLARVRALRANLWLMSPPCQPFSRLGNRRGLDDARCKPLLHLLELLEALPESERPSRLLLENVQGFEASPAAERLVDSLEKCGFQYRQLLLSPLQFGVPNSRLRFYLLAWRPASVSEQPAAARILPAGGRQLIADRPPTSLALPACDCPVCRGRLRPDQLTHDPHLRCYRPYARPLSDYLSPEADTDADLYLTRRQLDQFFSVLDIRQPRSRATCCFTKGYGKRIEGTGSFVQTKRLTSGKPCHDRVKACRRSNQSAELSSADQQLSADSIDQIDFAPAGGDAMTRCEPDSLPDDLSDDEFGNTADNAIDCDTAGGVADYAESLGLRYFSPGEVASLMHFPADYRFPDKLTRRQAYQMLGNSVNVLVIAHLLSYLLLS